MQMTKADFIDRVAGKMGSKREAAEAVETVLDGISDALANGEEVNFTGFGKFHVTERSARQGVNPATGEKIQIAASKAPKFTAGSALKSAVKG
jgi:DNA-binding protein HU-beta